MSVAVHDYSMVVGGAEKMDRHVADAVDRARGSLSAEVAPRTGALLTAVWTRDLARGLRFA